MSGANLGVRGIWNLAVATVSRLFDDSQRQVWSALPTRGTYVGDSGGSRSHNRFIDVRLVYLDDAIVM